MMRKFSFSNGNTAPVLFAFTFNCSIRLKYALISFNLLSTCLVLFALSFIHVHQPSFSINLVLCYSCIKKLYLRMIELKKDDFFCGMKKIARDSLK
jgi:hypothetical protein